MLLIKLHDPLVEILHFPFPQGIQRQVLHDKHILQFDNHVPVLQTSVNHVFHPVIPGVYIYQSLKILRGIHQSIPIPILHSPVSVHDLLRLVTVLFGRIIIPHIHARRGPCQIRLHEIRVY